MLKKARRLFAKLSSLHAQAWKEGDRRLMSCCLNFSFNRVITICNNNVNSGGGASTRKTTLSGFECFAVRRCYNKLNKIKLIRKTKCIFSCSSNQLFIISKLFTVASRLTLIASRIRVDAPPTLRSTSRRSPSFRLRTTRKASQPSSLLTYEILTATPTNYHCYAGNEVRLCRQKNTPSKSLNF